MEPLITQLAWLNFNLNNDNNKYSYEKQEEIDKHGKNSNLQRQQTAGCPTN